jgi:hypothetical protein
MAKKTAAKKHVAKKSAPKSGVRKMTRPPARIAAAMKAGHPVAATQSSDLQHLLDVLRDKQQPIETRYAALQSLGAARFASPDFASIQGDYIAALREVSTDNDLELRMRVLGILSREKDGYAIKKLLDGLKKPDQALVPPEKGLQLLGNDIHTEAYPVAREILKNPPNQTARREALRLLAADANSAPTFESILQDKNEPAEIRQISAAALHSLKPEKLQQQARKILLDPSEGDDMHQVSLTALTQFGKPDLAKDDQLVERVSQMSNTAAAPLKKSAKRFLGKYNA